ncbi:hypothetical protein [Thauera humireducens]|uniref:hypothetical protein n=1 Tax=Thauera humireducens TaxID=1134435 RepID=UPI003C7517A0
MRTGGSVWLTAKDDDFNNGWCVRTSSDDCGTDDPADLLDHPALDTQLVLELSRRPGNHQLRVQSPWGTCYSGRRHCHRDRAQGLRTGTGQASNRHQRHRSDQH